MPDPTEVIEVAGDVLVEQPKLEHELILRIAHSESFRGAQMLQHLLLYLAGKGRSGEAGALKEYSIGVEALGRKQDFDPKIDPIVRVQMHRLRQKLKEYYVSEGATDPLILEIPKGGYLPAFSSPSVAKAEESIVESAPLPVPLLEPDNAGIASRRQWRSGKTVFLIAGAFLCGILTVLAWMRVQERTALSTLASMRNSDPVQKFWTQFLGSDSSPVIGYPDAVFLLDESNDLFRFRQGATDQRGALVNPNVVLQFASNPALASKAGPLYYENGYTGTGELESIAALSMVFARIGVKPIIKSSRDITTADLNQHNVILLGSPFQNRAVAQLPEAGDFVFENPDAHRELWRAHILNRHPKPNETQKYQTERDAATGALKTDYGLITVMNGVAPGLHIAMLGGLDTTGTRGATSFAVSPDGVARMKNSLASLVGGKSSGFQALLKTNLEMGYQVLDTRMLALHEMQSTGSEDTKIQAAATSATR